MDRDRDKRLAQVPLMLVLLAIVVVSWSCDSDPCTPVLTPAVPASLSDLEVEFVRGYFGGDFMPGLAAWYVGVTLALENTHPDSALAGIGVSYADAYLATQGELLGRVSLSSDWSGYLAAGERDTVQFRFRSRENPFEGYTWLELRRLCFQTVRLEVGIHDKADTVTAYVDSLWFSCAD